MNEQEQKAIEYLKKHILVYYGEGKEIEFLLSDVLLKLIEKQQQEIKTLKESQLVLYDKEGNIIACLKLGKDVVGKEKIRELYKEYRHTGHYEVEAVLEELLGEEDVTKI